MVPEAKVGVSVPELIVRLLKVEFTGYWGPAATSSAIGNICFEAPRVIIGQSITCQVFGPGGNRGRIYGTGSEIDIRCKCCRQADIVTVPETGIVPCIKVKVAVFIVKGSIASLKTEVIALLMP